MICGYSDCNQEIPDNQYSYQYFPEEKKHKPVHSYHLSTTRKERDHATVKADEPQEITPVKDLPTEEDLS